MPVGNAKPAGYGAKNIDLGTGGIVEPGSVKQGDTLVAQSEREWSRGFCFYKEMSDLLEGSYWKVL